MHEIDQRDPVERGGGGKAAKTKRKPKKGTKTGKKPGKGKSKSAKEQDECQRDFTISYYFM